MSVTKQRGAFFVKKKFMPDETLSAKSYKIVIRFADWFANLCEIKN